MLTIGGGFEGLYSGCPAFKFLLRRQQHHTQQRIMTTPMATAIPIKAPRLKPAKGELIAELSEEADLLTFVGVRVDVCDMDEDGDADADEPKLSV